MTLFINMEQQALRISFRRDTNVSELIKENQNNASHVELFRKTQLLQNAVFGNRNRKEKKIDLRQILKKAKVKILTKNFAKKLRRNSIYRPLADYLKASQQEDSVVQNTWQDKLKKLGDTNGIDLSNLGLAIWSFANIIQITAMVFIFSIMLTFPETSENPTFLYFRISSILLYIIDMIFNFITQRYECGKKLQTLGEISHYYLRNGFFIDLISIVIFPIDLFVDSNVTLFISLVAIIKLINNVRKFQKFEYLYINTSEKQQYYGLIKVFMTNFAIGHFLSIILNLMTMTDSEQNWVTKLGIDGESWFIKYIWGYYWGTNIMLTVGFGDISATNYHEAIILIFIETFSCITLAYNISYVGALIGSISEKNACKKKKMKTLHRMCKQNEVSSQIEGKLSNFIQQFYRIKQTFSYDDEDQVLEFLPKSMQLQYRKQSNKILFDNLGFLGNMSKKTLLKLAESVSRKICLPEEIIIKKGAVSGFIILQKGEISMACKTRSKLEGKIIETITVEDASKPRIFSLDFIKNKICQFNLKSMKYSVLYCLSRQQFMNSLKRSEMDFQLFCVLRDRDQFLLDQNNLYQCELCKNQFHNKFECPQLHYMPLKQNVIYKNLEFSKKKRQPRIPHTRYPLKFQNFKCYDQVRNDQKKFIKSNYDEDQLKKMESLIHFYQNLPNKKMSLTSMELPTISQKISKAPAKNLGPKIGEQKAIELLQELLYANAKQSSFWDMQCDEAYNFRYYFQGSNPANLSKARTNKKFSKFLFCDEVSN